jgi:NADH-quinone oxidoreductase subunit E
MSQTATAAPSTPARREFKPEVKEELERICSRYPTRRAGLLPAYRLLEREFGCVDVPGMRLVAELLNLPPAYVQGVFTFYTHYHRPTDGKYVIEICRTLPCALRGADTFAENVQKALGIKIGETSKDGKFSLKNAECMAACDKAPVCQINAHYHENLTVEKLKQIVDALP